MADREKLMVAQRCAAGSMYCGAECPYWDKELGHLECEKRIAKDALEVLALRPPEHVHEEYPEHDWERDDEGAIDEWAWEDSYSMHHGPACRRCLYSFCVHCEPDGWKSRPCVIDNYRCPECGRIIGKGTKYCPDCGQGIEWSSKET